MKHTLRRAARRVTTALRRAGVQLAAGRQAGKEKQRLQPNHRPPQSFQTKSLQIEIGWIFGEGEIQQHFLRVTK